MINKLFILNIFTVTLVEFAGVGGMAPEAGGAVPTIQIICKKEENSQKPGSIAKTSKKPDPIAEKFNTLSGKFNKLVTQYFVNNFGDGGEKYLQFVRGVTKEVEKVPRDCQELPPAYEKEMEKIVSVFEEPSGLFRRFKKKKELDQVRFRVHRFLGILSLCASKNDSECDISVGIDYHFAFSGSERNGLNSGLNEFKSSIPLGQKSEIAVPQMVSDCLRAIGGATLAFGRGLETLPIIEESCSSSLRFYNSECIRTVTRANAVTTETCRVLPLFVKKMADGKEGTIGQALGRFFISGKLIKNSSAYNTLKFLASEYFKGGNPDVFARVIHSFLYGMKTPSTECWSGLTSAASTLQSPMNSVDIGGIVSKCSSELPTMDQIHLFANPVKPTPP
jgi:hypothetical protein